MKVGKSITRAESGSMSEYMMLVLEATSKLFFLLEAAEGIKAEFESGERKTSRNSGFGPSTLSIGLRSSLSNVPYTLDQEFGPTGRMAQLAYLGWVAAVDGAWEKYRTNPPYDRKGSGLKHGQEATLFGDLHKIRNDLLKNRGIAQVRNTGKCTEFLWFKPGDKMHMSLDHVLDFLHRLGGYMRNFLSGDGKVLVAWCVKDEGPSIGEPYRVISNRVFIEALPEDRGSGFGLFIGMVFADGLAWTVLVWQAATRKDLVNEAKVISAAPLDRYGSPILPKEGPMDVPRTYRMARDAILASEVPLDPGTPFVRFRR